MRVRITVICCNGNGERVLELPGHMEVCYRCKGHGTILNPNIGEHAYSVEEFDEAFPYGSEEREHYFKRGGMYDVTCPDCKGRNVVPVIDRDYLRNGTKAKRSLLARIENKERNDAEYERERAWERRMGY